MNSEERFLATNTLTVFLKGLTGKQVQVEMKNETVASGTLSYVDGYGNMTLTDARITTVHGQTSTVPLCVLKNKSMRYVHPPDGEKPAKVIKYQLNSLNRQYEHILKRRKPKLDEFDYGDE